LLSLDSAFVVTRPASCKKEHLHRGHFRSPDGPLRATAALSFVILTGEVMGLRPAQGAEKRLLFGRHFPRQHRPPLCHLDRSSEGA